jgi:hypothetical protein
MGGGGPAPIQWASVPLPSNIRNVIAVAAFSSTDLWIAADVTDGGPGAVLYLNNLGQWGQVLQTSGAGSFSDLAIIASPARIAVAEPTFVYECDHSMQDCKSPSQWVAFPTDSAQSFVNKLCTDGARFYATGSAEGSGALFANMFSTYVLLTNFGGSPLEACTVIATGWVVSASTFGELFWYSPDGGGDWDTRVQGPGFDASSTNWIAAHTASGRSFFAGNDRTIVELLPDAGFALGMPASSPAPLRAIAGVSPDALIAAGDDLPPNGSALCDGTTWTQAPSLSPHFDVYGMTALDSHTYYAGGQLRGDDGGVTGGLLLKGTR